MRSVRCVGEGYACGTSAPSAQRHNLMTRHSASLLVCIALALLVGRADAIDDVAQPVEVAIPADDSAAKKLYGELMEQAEGDGRSCMIADTFKDNMLKALRD